MNFTYLSYIYFGTVEWDDQFVMSEDSSNVSVSMDEIAQHVQFVPQKTLQDIARGPLVQYALTCEDNQ